MKDKIITVVTHIIIGMFVAMNIWVVISSVIYKFSNPALTETQVTLHTIKTYWWVMLADIIGYIVINNEK